MADFECDRRAAAVLPSLRGSSFPATPPRPTPISTLSTTGACNHLRSLLLQRPECLPACAWQLLVAASRHFRQFGQQRDGAGGLHSLAVRPAQLWRGSAAAQRQRLLPRLSALPRIQRRHVIGQGGLLAPTAIAASPPHPTAPLYYTVVACRHANAASPNVIVHFVIHYCNFTRHYPTVRRQAAGP